MKTNRQGFGIGTKAFVLILAAAMLCGGAIGGTVAWITSSYALFDRTFTYGNIELGFTAAEESEEDADRLCMVPGTALEMNTELYVTEGSEACWLFAEIRKSENFDDFITYETADGWTALEGEENVYYRQVIGEAGDDFTPGVLEEEFKTDVIKDNKLEVRADVLIEQFDELTDETRPMIEIYAYAVQRANIDSPETAWLQITPAQEE